MNKQTGKHNNKSKNQNYNKNNKKENEVKKKPQNKNNNKNEAIDNYKENKKNIKLEKDNFNTLFDKALNEISKLNKLPNKKSKEDYLLENAKIIFSSFIFISSI